MGAVYQFSDPIRILLHLLEVIRTFITVKFWKLLATSIVPTHPTPRRWIRLAQRGQVT